MLLWTVYSAKQITLSLDTSGIYNSLPMAIFSSKVVTIIAVCTLKFINFMFFLLVNQALSGQIQEIQRIYSITTANMP